MGAVFSPGEDAVQCARPAQFDVTETPITSLSATITYNTHDTKVDGAWTLVEYTVPPRFSAQRPPWHNGKLAGFFVIAGTLTLYVDDQRAKASSGSFMVVPPGEIHRLANESDVPVTFLTVVAPGGWDHYADTFAQAVASKLVSRSPGR